MTLSGVMALILHALLRQISFRIHFVRQQRSHRIYFLQYMIGDIRITDNMND